MTRFLQLHLLTFYPPANLNRDDSGRPKTATVGGVPRLRISSQSLKRAWRTSELFHSALEGHLAERTQRLGEVVREHLVSKGAAPDKALAIAREVAGAFGAVKKEDKSDLRKAAWIEQLAFVSPEEKGAALAMAERIAAGEAVPKLEDMRNALLGRSDTAADVAMFGRMLAASPEFNREAAVQVAHAITVHKAVVEDDYYVAVDDLNRRTEDAGAGFVGEQGFGSGIFYLYVCVDVALLVRNLQGDRILAGSAMAALAEAAATVAPGGKQASFASRACAHYLLAESGDRQPRTLAAAFLRPMPEHDPIAASIKALRNWRDNLDKVYHSGEGESHVAFDVSAGTGSLVELVSFCRASAGA